MENNKLASFANLEAKGRELVAVVRIRPGAGSVDILDYDNPRIWAIIPGYKDKDGVITSLKTGMPVRTGWRDSVRSVRVGTAFDYEGGASIIFTRKWDKGNPIHFLAERTGPASTCVLHRAFGEELKKDPELI